MEKRSPNDGQNEGIRRNRRPQGGGGGRGRNKESTGPTGLICSSHPRSLAASGASAMTTASSARPPVPAPKKTLSTEIMRLAAVAMDLNIRVRSASMPVAMQERAFRYTRSLLLGRDDHQNCKGAAVAPDSKSNPKPPTSTQIALAIKKEFDESYGLAWHCIVGKSFGSFVTHSPGGFVYFSVDKLSILLFKTEVRLQSSS